jgi:hypothetical protein
MNDQELFDNFFNACVAYAEDNGAAITDPSTLCELVDNGDGKIIIKSWNHNSTKPTNAQLKTYTSSQVQQKDKKRKNQSQVDNGSPIPQFTVSEKNALTPTNGTLIFNTTQKKLEIYIDGWKTVTVS